MNSQVKNSPTKNQNLGRQHPEQSAAQDSSSEPACMSLCFWETSWGGHPDPPESTEATTCSGTNQKTEKIIELVGG